MKVRDPQSPFSSTVPLPRGFFGIANSPSPLTTKITPEAVGIALTNEGSLCSKPPSTIGVDGMRTICGNLIHDPLLYVSSSLPSEYLTDCDYPRLCVLTDVVVSRSPHGKCYPFSSRLSPSDQRAEPIPCCSIHALGQYQWMVRVSFHV